MKFSTKAIHVGQKPDPTNGAIIPPIYMTSTYVQQAPGEFKGYDYTRAGNPNFTNLEHALASLEDAEYATVFSSGLGAFTALASLLQSGDKVMAINDLYGGTYRLFRRVFEKFGVEFILVDMQDQAQLDNAFAQKPRMLILESPTNPLLKITDIRSVTAQAREHGVVSVVDNTFASPYFQKPIPLGADAVLHSSTKYIGGHSDLIGGAIITNDAALKKELDFARMALGVNPSPFDVWLTQRSIKTLAVRMEQHQTNALAVVSYLQKHPQVKHLYYPGLDTHPNHAVAKQQMSGFSGMVSAEFHMPLEQMKQFISSFHVFSLAESLGGIESLIDHPASMTHMSIPKEEREKIGLMDGLVRFSVGIEHQEDLIEDFEQAFLAIKIS